MLPLEQKGCRRGSRGTEDQLLIDKMVLRDCRRRHINLSMAWIDCKKAFDTVPHSWILECLEFVGCAGNIRRFLELSMNKWKCQLSAGDEVLGCVNIRRGIFQWDSLSPLLFVLCMVPLTLVLCKVKAGYETNDKSAKINHLLYMDDLKLYGKSQEQIESLVCTIPAVSSDIGMEFGIRKCGILNLKRGKVWDSEGIVLSTGDTLKVIGYKYLGVLEMEDILVVRMKDSIRKEYFRRLRLILRSKLKGKNKIMGINTWAVAVVRYGGGIIDWNIDELRQMDRKTRKMITMYGAFHPKSDIDRLYLPRNRGGRGLIGCEVVLGDRSRLIVTKLS